MVYKWTDNILKNRKGKLILIYKIFVNNVKTNATKNYKQYHATDSYCYQSI